PCVLCLLFRKLCKSLSPFNFPASLPWMTLQARTGRIIPASTWLSRTASTDCQSSPYNEENQRLLRVISKQYLLSTCLCSFHEISFDPLAPALAFLTQCSQGKELQAIKIGV